MMCNWGVSGGVVDIGVGKCAARVGILDVDDRGVAKHLRVGTAAIWQDVGGILDVM